MYDFLTEVLEKLSKEEFYLAFLGLFKRGKSTLINALLGLQVLPTGVVPVTSVITRIRYGQELTAKISFSDGSATVLSVDALKDYVTEAGNPDNAKNVTIADVFAPVPILKDGLILIDTPGVGSTFFAGTKVTFQFLNRTDFAVFVVAVDPPVGQQELEFLNSIAAQSDRIIVVLNKIDYVDPVSLGESIQFCQKIIAQQFGSMAEKKLQVYPLSAKKALQGRLNNNTEVFQSSLMPAFESALNQALANEKQELVLTSTKNKLLKAASDLTNYVQLQIYGLTMPLANLEHAQEEFEQYISTVEQRKRELFYILNGKAKEVISLLDDDLATFKKTQESILVNNVEVFAQGCFASKDCNSREVVKEVEEYLRKELINIFSEFISEEDKKVAGRFQNLVTEANERINALISDVKKKAAELFGFESNTVSFSASLDFKTRFYFHLDPIFMTGITFSAGELAELLPKSLFKGILNKRLNERISAEFDKNSGRIRYDYFVSRINQAFLNFKKDLDQVLASSTETVKRALEEAKRLGNSDAQDVNNRITGLNQLLYALENIKDELRQ